MELPCFFISLKPWQDLGIDLVLKVLHHGFQEPALGDVPVDVCDRPVHIPANELIAREPEVAPDQLSNPFLAFDPFHFMKFLRDGLSGLLPDQVHGVPGTNGALVIDP